MSSFAGRGWGISLPLMLLVVVLGSTLWLAMERDRDLSALQERLDASAQQELELEQSLALAQIEGEADRLTELMLGLAAFAAGTDEAAITAAIDTYVEATGATQRFAGLIDASVVSQPGARPAGSSTLGDELSNIVAEGESTTPALTFHFITEGRVAALSFPVEAASTTQWVSLILTAETFLSPTLLTRPQFETTLRTAAESSGPGRALLGEPSLTATAEGSLTVESDLNMFGTNLTLRTASRDNYLQSASRAQVWILISAGAVASFGAYMAMRSLIDSRATALQSAETAGQRRAAVDRRFRASFDTAPIGMAEVDPNGCLTAVNATLCRQAGLNPEQLIGQALSALVHDEDRAEHLARMQSLLDGTNNATQGEYRLRQPNGAERWIHESASVIEADAEGRRSILVQSQDITKQKQASWELAQQALHDDLTGLPNRALFLNRLRQGLNRAERNQTRLAVMFLDIDRFKVINDSLGHNVGDDLLVQIADRIGLGLRAGDTVARFGGDEFVILCETVSGDIEAATAAARIQGAFAEPFMLAETPTHVTASIGICLSTHSGESADALLRDADAAMYRAKDSGRNQIEIFNNSMRANILDRMELESQLRDALINNEIVMHYQAIVDPNSHLPVGYEALMRWNHPQRGLLAPDSFLSVAEEAGLMHLIDAFALRAACHQIASWVDQFPAARNLYVATNWSTRHLGRFILEVEEVLAETLINPHQLVVEVTEGFLLDDTDGSVRALQRLRQLGVQVAIDDFGTGYSSLAYLTRFAVDFLKIDQSFIAKLPEDGASATVVRAIVDLATHLGIQVVAEGVETDEQIETLLTMGSPRLQGYRFAKPRPASEIEQHLHERSLLANYEAEFDSLAL